MGNKLFVARQTTDDGEDGSEGHICESNGCCNKTNINTSAAEKRLDQAVAPGSPAAHKSLENEEEMYMLLAKEKEERCRLLEEEMEENNRLLKEDLFKKENDLQGLKRHIDSLHARHREDVLTLNEELKHYQENCRDLSMRIERAEQLHSQRSMADSGSYQDSAATPPLLQHAADAVKDAITVCASELFSRIKKNSLPVDLAYMDIDPKDTGQIVKVAWQNFLCHILFDCFEDPFFLMFNGFVPSFDKPAKRKNQFLQAYKRCRDMDARQMHKEDMDFAYFFDFKAFQVGEHLKEQLLMTDDAQRKEDFISLELGCANSSYYGKFLRLAKAVWVLHKLAFAFEPIAEIFRVGPDSILDVEFMEDVAGDDDDDSDEDDERMAENANTVKQVRFMCVPGFIVRHTIIKSRVFSLKESQPCVCSTRHDPSAMALD